MENKEVDVLLEICNKHWKNEDVTIEEIETLAYSDIYDYSDELFDYIVGTFHSFMTEHGKSWEECEDECTNNPYHTGYELDGIIFITHYSGIAGRYWNGDGVFTICKW